MEFIDRPSPNYWTDPQPIKAIVLHGTSGPLQPSIEWLCNPQTSNPDWAVSANFVISKKGVIYRLVDPLVGRKAWANGVIDRPDPTIKWLQSAIAEKINPNRITYSIEHEASGEDMRWNRSMTDAQFNSSISLAAWLLIRSGLPATHETILGHCQISSRQKATCPGVIFVPAYLQVLLMRYPKLGEK